MTDYYDLDATIAFTGSSLSRVASNFSNPTRMRKHLEVGRHGVESLVVELSAPLGKLRYLSKRCSLDLALSDFPVHVVVRNPGYVIEVEKMVDIALQKTSTCSHDFDSLLSLYLSESYDEEDEFYCSGHDIHRVLTHLVRQRWGGSGGEDNIANAIRAALSREELEKTRLYLEVDQWSTRTRHDVWRQAA